MAQDVSQIIQELDAAYNPSRQSINDRINGLQGAQDADLAGLESQKTNAFEDITNGARSRGMGFSGIPMQEQAKYIGSSYIPAVSQIKSNYAAQRGGLSDALNSLNMDQRKTAMSLRETQLDREYQAEQAAAARRAADTSSNALSSLLSGGGGTQVSDPFAQLGGQKQQAANALVSLFKTNDPATIKKTYDAISSSAAKGNLYDRYKLELIKQYQANSGYGNLIKSAMSYKPAASQISVGQAKQPTLSLGSAKQMTLR